MHQLASWSLGEWLAAAAIGGVSYAAWRYDAWRHENGYVEFNASDENRIIPNPESVVAENKDMQHESADDDRGR